MSRIHIVTLGVSDINRSLRFYRDGMGFLTTVTESDPPIVFFQSQGVTLALYSRDGLAEDIDEENPPAGEGFSGITLATVVHRKEEVDEVLAQAERAGGTVVKSARDAFWGGYHGYFADPDGYYWEVAYSEGWQFNDDGSLLIE